RRSALMRRVPPVEHQRVAVGILEVGHVTDAGLERLAGELDALRLERLARLLYIGHAERDRRRVRPLERLPDVRRVEQVEAHVLAEGEFGPAAMADLLEAARLRVEARRPLEVGHGNRDEVAPLHGDHESVLPSARGAQRWWSIRSLPSGSRKNAMWQTPESSVSPANSTPFVSSSARAAWTSSTAKAMCPFRWGANSIPNRAGSQIPKHCSPAQNSACACSSGLSPSVST